jgi:hypothetical protein
MAGTDDRLTVDPLTSFVAQVGLPIHVGGLFSFNSEGCRRRMPERDQTAAEGGCRIAIGRRPKEDTGPRSGGVRRRIPDRDRAAVEGGCRSVTRPRPKEDAGARPDGNRRRCRSMARRVRSRKPERDQSAAEKGCRSMTRPRPKRVAEPPSFSPLAAQPVFDSAVPVRRRLHQTGAASGSGFLLPGVE